MIEISGVTKTYGRRAALDNVSLTVRPGEVTLLLGANGAGKSTLLRCLLGVTSFAGTIRVNGLDPLTDGRAVRARIGYMPQSGGLHPDLTVAETMALYADIRQVPRDRGVQLLRQANLDDHAETLVGELSGGMRQRLGFALALLANPQILVLDEPSASLDAASREWLARRLREVASEGRTVLVSTHAGQELLDAGDVRVTLDDGHVGSVTSASAAASVITAVSLPEQGPEFCTDQPLRASAPRRDRSLQGAPSPARVSPLIRKEWRDAIGNRWLMGYAALLGVLGLAATASGLDGASGLAMQGFGRTTATLMNLCLLLAPLVAVLMGAAAIAGEQDRGTLEPLLAQPLSRTQLLLGKHAGLLMALVVATVAGFVPAGLVIAYQAGPGALAYYAIFPAIASLAAAAMLGVGLLISVTSRSAVQAQGAAVFAWFAFALLYDLILIGSLAVSGLPAPWLAATLFANPIDAARVLGVLALEPDLYLLGPAGAWLSTQLAPTGAVAALLAALVCWAVLPLAAAVFAFSRSLRRNQADVSKELRVVAGRERTGHRDRVRVGRGVAGA